MTKLLYEEVKKRIESANGEVVDDMCQLGQILVSDGVDRIAKLDGKANGVAAYCGGVLTLAVSTITLWGSKISGIFEWIAAIGIIGLITAAAVALQSTFPLNTEWHSDDDWLRAELLQDALKMKRYRVLTMWKIIDSLDGAHVTKQKRLSFATTAVLVAMFFLFIAFLQVTWLAASL